MWTEDLQSILQNFLLSNEHRILIAYMDQHTSSLQLVYSIATMANSINTIYHLCYFIRKHDSLVCITSITEFLKHIQFGNIHGKSIPCLTAIVSTLFGPLFMDNASVHDSIY